VMWKGWSGPMRVFYTQHPKRGDSYVPTRHFIAYDLGEYMTFRAGVILGRLLSVSMEIGWTPDCALRRSMMPLLGQRGIEVPPGEGWVHCEFQTTPPPLWFFDQRYGALCGENGPFRFLCNQDGSRPAHLLSDPPVEFDWRLNGRGKERKP